MNNVYQTAAAVAEAGGPSKLADELGVSAQAVCFWRDGKRTLPVEHGAALERLAPKNGRRWQIWPQDWYRMWPELVGTQGLPSRSSDCTCGAWEMSEDDSAVTPKAATPDTPVPLEAVGAPATAFAYGGRREEDITDSGFGMLDSDGPTLAREIDAVGRLTGDVPRREADDAS